MKITLNKLLLGYLQKKNAFSRAALDGVTGRGSLTLCGGDGFDIFHRRSKFRRCKEIAEQNRSAIYLQNSGQFFEGVQQVKNTALVCEIFEIQQIYGFVFSWSWGLVRLQRNIWKVPASRPNNGSNLRRCKFNIER